MHIQVGDGLCAECNRQKSITRFDKIKCDCNEYDSINYVLHSFDCESCIEKKTCIKCHKKLKVVYENPLNRPC
jgi:hypothetical protein